MFMLAWVKMYTHFASAMVRNYFLQSLKHPLVPKEIICWKAGTDELI